MFTRLVDEWVDEQAGNLGQRKKSDLPYISQQTNETGGPGSRPLLCHPEGLGCLHLSRHYGNP